MYTTNHCYQNEVEMAKDEYILKIEITKVEKKYIPVLFNNTNVINSNQREADIKMKSVAIELDLKAFGDNKTIKKMY
ncbi:7698_t:CDS:2, partial [Gigaspora margarita]